MVITDQQERIGLWFAKQTNIDYVPNKFVYIGLLRNDEIVAATAYNDFRHDSINIHIVLTGKLTREFIWYAFHYPFIEVGVKKIIGPIESNNTKCLKFIKHIGFELEAVIKDGGNKCDLHLVTMTKEQCRYLK